jgi:hypothetical protein
MAKTSLKKKNLNSYILIRPNLSNFTIVNPTRPNFAQPFICAPVVWAKVANEPELTDLSTAQ